MNQSKRFLRARKLVLIALFIASSLAVLGRYFYVHGEDRSGFPDGFDAVQAAPNSHKVIFENEFVRVLEVTVPARGTTEPMHHHRWPSFFLTGIPEAEDRIYVITDPTAACGIVLARKSELIPALGVRIG